MEKFKVEKVNQHIAIVHLTEQQVVSMGSNEDELLSENIYRAMLDMFDSPYNVDSLSSYEGSSKAIHDAVFASQKKRLFKKVDPIQQVVFGTTTYMFKFDPISHQLKITFMAIRESDPDIFPTQKPAAAPLPQAAVKVPSEMESKIEQMLITLRASLNKLILTKLTAEQEFNVERLSIACRTIDRLLMEVSQFPSESRKTEALLTAHASLNEIAVTLGSIEDVISDDIIREMKILQIYLNMKNRSIEL